MKFIAPKRELTIDESHPARGAWIEMPRLMAARVPLMSHPARGAWIEMALRLSLPSTLTSHPARGAWIEITEKP